MSIDLTQAISWLISLLALTVTIFNLANKGTKDDTTAITTVVVKLEEIQKTINRMDNNMTDTQGYIRRLENRLIACEIAIGLKNKEDDK